MISTMHTSAPRTIAIHRGSTVLRLLTPARRQIEQTHRGPLWERMGKRREGAPGVTNDLILVTWKNTSAQIWDSKVRNDLGRQ